MYPLRGCHRLGSLQVSGFDQFPDGPVTLGFRAEDAHVSNTSAELNIQVYSLELLGDSTLVTARVGESLVAIKSSKDYSVAIGAEVGIHITASICHLFDPQSGQRFKEHKP